LGPRAVRSSMIEGALRRDRVVVVVALLSVILLAWGYILFGAGMSMHEMSDMPMAQQQPTWTPAYSALVLTMWGVMMAAMMLPSAAPMILLYGTIAHRRELKGVPAIGAGVFGLGYIAVWSAFSLAAVGLQFELDQAQLLSPMMTVTSRSVAGGVLIAAGVYQWTPLKHACLRRCRSPLEFLMTQWREGRVGALKMGLRHGAYCLGCCWMLMLLLFVGGIMNIAWIAAIAAFVLIEKVSPAGHWIGRVTGVLLVVWGAAILAV
jgi:predicted metal-binding membrane protein